MHAHRDSHRKSTGVLQQIREVCKVGLVATQSALGGFLCDVLCSAHLNKNALGALQAAQAA